jgi:hypothetical protein
MNYEEKQLPELNFIKHLHDNDTEFVNYSEKMVEKNFSSYMFKNNKMGGFLYLIQPLIVKFFDMFNVIKNWTNYTVDKDYYKHKN